MSRTSRAEESSIKAASKQEIIRILGGIGVLALAILLLSWGLSATQWTVLTSESDLPNPVGNGVIFGSYTHSYSVPQGAERDIYMEFFFAPKFGGSLVGPDGSFFNVAPPVQNSSTTIKYYVGFLITNPNGSAVNVWFTGPQGNLTQPCRVPQVVMTYVVCTLIPTPAGTGLGPYSQYYEVSMAGNYTLHILSTQCPSDYNYCTSSTAALSVSRAFSMLTYSRPYYNYGLITVIAAGVATAVAVAYLSITGYRILNQRQKMRPPRSPAPRPAAID